MKKKKDKKFKEFMVEGKESYDKMQQAIKFFNNTLKLNPKNIDALERKAIYLSRVYQEEESLKCFDKILQIDPKNVNALTRKGEIFYQLSTYNGGLEQKRFKESLRCFDKALKIKPNDEQAFVGKITTLKGLGEYKKVIKCYELLINNEPKRVRWYYETGELYYQLEEYVKSINYDDIAIKLSKFDNGALFNKGLSLMNLKKYNEAIKCFNGCMKIAKSGKGVSLGISLDSYFYNKGLALFYLKKYEDAIKCFEECLKYDNAELALYQKGMALTKLKKFEEAINCFKKVIIMIQKKGNNEEKYILKQNSKARIYEIKNNLIS